MVEFSVNLNVSNSSFIVVISGMMSLRNFELEITILAITQ